MSPPNSSIFSRHAVAFSLFVALAGCAQGPTFGGGQTGGGATGGGATGAGTTGGGTTGGGTTGGGTTGGGTTGGGTTGGGTTGGGAPGCAADAGLAPQFTWTAVPPLVLLVGDGDAPIAAVASAPTGDCTVPVCTPAYSVTPSGVASITAVGGVTVLRALDSGTAFVTADCGDDGHYVAATQLKRPVTFGAKWEVTTLAGSGAPGSANALGAAATFTGPTGVTLDNAGTLYVADTANNLIRKITSAGQVATLAGSGQAGSDNRLGTQATFTGPTGVAVDDAGIVYVADEGNNLVRKISVSGDVTTLAGGGVGTAVGAGGALVVFDGVRGITVDTGSNVYISDANNHRIRKITPTALVTTFAGSGDPGQTNGASRGSTFNYPFGVAVDSSGTVYVADTGNHVIRKITAGQVTTLAGNGAPGSANDAGTSASFTGVSGVAVDSSGTVYVADTGNHSIRRITPSGQVTTIAGNGAPGAVNDAGTVATFRNPKGVAVDGSGNLYVADTDNNVIRKISPQ